MQQPYSETPCLTQVLPKLQNPPSRHGHPPPPDQSAAPRGRAVRAPPWKRRPRTDRKATDRGVLHTPQVQSLVFTTRRLSKLNVSQMNGVLFLNFSPLEGAKKRKHVAIRLCVLDSLKKCPPNLQSQPISPLPGILYYSFNTASRTTFKVLFHLKRSPSWA